MLGRDLLQRALGASPAGFVAPAWLAGAATLPALEGCGFRYLAAFGSLCAGDRPPIPLATWSWDWGVIGPFGRAGQRFGDLQARLRPGALPCVVVHPADADRGYLPRILPVVDPLLGQGRTPRLLGEFLA